MDGNDLMATHYCAAHNQPRMVLVSGGDRIAWSSSSETGPTFNPTPARSGSRLRSMDQIVTARVDWIENGKEAASPFRLQRKQ